MTIPTFVFRAIPSSSAPADSEEWRADYVERLKAAIAQRKPPEGQEESEYQEQAIIVPADKAAV
jgi:hypothetical protein